MGLRRSKNETSHIQYSPVDEMTDDEVSEQISSMKNASESNPRKIALRRERINRCIAARGLAEVESLLGIHDIGGRANA